jgi:dTDP-4-dehydrorhamnose reductase
MSASPLPSPPSPPPSQPSDPPPPRVVAVVGATGQLGRDLVRAFAARPGWTVRSLGHDEIEVTDAQSVARALDPLPDVVLNSTLGDWSRQDDPRLSLEVNALGPRLLAERCAAGGALLVHISTDFVFDGDGSVPYAETDRAEPRSVYGITKLAGEQLVRAALDRHLIVRVSYLFGPGGSRAKRGTNVVTQILDWGRGAGPVRLVSDQTFSPTYAPDAAAAVLRLVEGEVRGTVHVTNSGTCTPLELGQEVYRLAGISTPVVPVRLADLPPGPFRPRYTVLAHNGLRRAGVPSPRPWQEAVREYMSTLVQLSA